MRNLLFLLVVPLPIGCGATDNDAPAKSDRAEEARVQPDLYSDEEAMKVAGYDPNALPAGAEIPFLDVVPNGETRPLGKVLKALGLNAARLREPRFHGGQRIFVSAWQISPSYDLVFMCDISGFTKLFDESLEVYGIQVVKTPPGDRWLDWRPGK
jgi:hypothetical protein